MKILEALMAPCGLEGRKEGWLKIEEVCMGGSVCMSVKLPAGYNIVNIRLSIYTVRTQESKQDLPNYTSLCLVHK